MNRHRSTTRAELKGGEARIRQVLECGSPLPLWEDVGVIGIVQSGRGLPHSKTLTRHPARRHDSLRLFFSKVWRSSFVGKSVPTFAGTCLLLQSLLPFITLAQPTDIRFPTVTNAPLTVSLISAEPEIVTPIGVSVDASNRVFVVESHTHFPPANYRGPKTDRILVFDDTDGDRKPDRRRVFFEGLKFSMNLMFDSDGSLYVTHRNGVMLFTPPEGSKTLSVPYSGQPRQIVSLETSANYPHNGMGSVTSSDDGWMYLGLGENQGLPYTMRGSDGTSQTGGGEGGRVFRCRLDGSHLELFATGFWNPFGLAFLNSHFLLGIDNDADSRPPCRLLDVIQGGDYGFQYKHGRTGLHPFSCWNGELPGTLPMAAGTGEAPSGILTGFKKNVPAALTETTAWVTSWGDHRIEAFSLQPVGASLRAEAVPILTGDDTFRPVGIAAAPDGSVYVTDWVSRDYTLHGKGRLWRITQLKETSHGNRLASIKTSMTSEARVRLEQIQNGTQEYRRLLGNLQDNDPFIRSGALWRLSVPEFQEKLRDELSNPSPRVRLGAVLTLGRLHDPRVLEELPDLLVDPSEEIRLVALIAAAGSDNTAFLPLLPKALSGGRVSPRLLEAYQAANLQLSRKDGPDKSNKPGASKTRPNTPRTTHIIELENQQNQEETAALELFATANALPPAATLAQAARVLGFSHNPLSTQVLSKTALNRSLPIEVRCEAVVALSANGPDQLPKILSLLKENDASLRREAARALAPLASSAPVATALTKALQREIANFKNPAVVEQLEFNLANGDLKKLPNRPKSQAEWASVLEHSGDVGAGRRLFYRPSPGCAKCHKVEGIGGQIGPDLSTVARGSNKEKLLRSILQPSAEVAPQFMTHILAMADGEQLTGLLSAEDADGSVALTMADSRAAWVPVEQIKSRRISSISLMPEGLEAAMTVQDFRDLIAFLLARN